MSEPKHTNLLKIFIPLVITVSLFTSFFVVAAEGNDAQCNDVALVFLRGSGQNEDGQHLNNPFSGDTFGDVEKESYSFFNWNKYHLDSKYPHVNYKAVTVHDFPGKYSDVGYKAVPVGFTWLTDPEREINSINAEASWFPGDYRDSVEQGIKETVGYLKDQIADCPDQSYIVGGYSQGAQVMGDSLFHLTEHERSKILSIGFFGDPKFSASTGDNLLNPFDDHTSYPWRRGTATNNDRGSLEARLPYVPTGMEKRVASYCFRSDMVCAGWSGSRWDGGTHGAYSGSPMMHTVSELIQWASPKLAEIEKERGGFTSEQTGVLGTQTDTKQRDVRFVLNDGSINSVIQTFRYDFNDVIYPASSAFPNTAFSMMGYSERMSSSVHFPQIDNVFSLLPYQAYDPGQPVTGGSNLSTIINKRYPFGQPMFQSGDVPDPHGLAIEKAVFNTGWRPNSEKHIVLFTDRVAKDPYKYSICYGDIYAWTTVPTSGYSTCYADHGDALWAKTIRSEACETAYLVITEEYCQNKKPDPGKKFRIIERSLNDVSAIAQSQGVIVDIVLPYALQDQYNLYDLSGGIQKLRQLAESTGGKLIYYDKQTRYDEALFSDTMYQVFNNKPKSLTAVYKEADDTQPEFNTSTVVRAGTKQPVIFDVSRSAQPFEYYRWDFNDDGVWDLISPGPVVEHSFDSPQAGFIRTAGVDEYGVTGPETRLAVAIVESTEAPQQVSLPEVPEVTVATQLNGHITLTWQSGEEGQLVVIDPESHLPIATAPLNLGELVVIPEGTYQQLEIRVINENGSSDPLVVQVPPVPTPPTTDPTPADPGTDQEVPGDEEIETPQENGEVPGAVTDPTMCYKLQLCNNETEAPDAIPTQAATTTTQRSLLGREVQPTVSVVDQPQIITSEETERQVAGVFTSNPEVVTNHHVTQTPQVPPKHSDINWWLILVVTASLIALPLAYISAAKRN